LGWRRPLKRGSMTRHQREVVDGLAMMETPAEEVWGLGVGRPEEKGPGSVCGATKLIAVARCPLVWVRRLVEGALALAVKEQGMVMVMTILTVGRLAVGRGPAAFEGVTGSMMRRLVAAEGAGALEPIEGARRRSPAGGARGPKTAGGTRYPSMASDPRLPRRRPFPHRCRTPGRCAGGSPRTASLSTRGPPAPPPPCSWRAGGSCCAARASGTLLCPPCLARGQAVGTPSSPWEADSVVVEIQAGLSRAVKMLNHCFPCPYPCPCPFPSEHLHGDHEPL